MKNEYIYYGTRPKFYTLSMRLQEPKRFEIYSITNQNLVNPPCAAIGAQLSVVRKKLNVVADGRQRRLGVVTDGTPEKGRRYSTFTHTERASVATIRP